MTQSSTRRIMRVEVALHPAAAVEEDDDGQLRAETGVVGNVPKCTMLHFFTAGRRHN
jgi:hypothetical protein